MSKLIPMQPVNLVSNVVALRIEDLNQERERQQEFACVITRKAPKLLPFFLTVFVFGQLTSQWAVWSGHVVAWVAGHAFSLIGIAAALISLQRKLVKRDNDLRNRLGNLNRTAARSSEQHPVSTSHFEFLNVSISEIEPRRLVV